MGDIKIPVKLEDCPIVEAILEIRFNPSVDQSAVFPILYGAIRNDFPKIEQRLPLQVPSSVTMNFPPLIQPLYRMRHKDDTNVQIQVGPNILTINMAPNYEGWDVFSELALKYVKALKDVNIVDSVQRVGYRVINFFDSNIFAKDSTMKILVRDDEIQYKDTSVHTIFVDGDNSSVVNIMNNAQLNNVPVIRKGSVVDIDTYCTSCHNFLDTTKASINAVHLAEKKVFFSLFNQDFIDSLNPTYED